MSSETKRPRRVAVVGAGMVGLSTAWFLLERGCQVTVHEQERVAAGASEGNAGWLTPGLAVPLPSPGILAYGARAVLSRNTPVHVPLWPDRQLRRFLLGFARHCTSQRWRAGVRDYVSVNARALKAYDELAASDPALATSPAEPFVVGFRTESQRRHVVQELEQLRAAGLPLSFDLIDGTALHRIQPVLSSAVTLGIRLHDQRFLDPRRYVAALADAVKHRGGEILAPVRIDDVIDEGRSVAVTTSIGQRDRFDAVVLATGASLSTLGRNFGVRLPVQAARGYSFSVRPRVEVSGPIYLPVQRIACTPLDGRLRIAGLMEFAAPGQPIDPRRLEFLAETARPLLSGVDVDDREGEWVGARPVTPDGLPLVGSTRSRRVFVAGGHGMWGIVLGPVTGKLLAQTITDHELAPELVPFDPLR